MTSTIQVNQGPNTKGNRPDTGPSSGTTSPTVLVIEDDRNFRRVMKRLLERQGVRALSAESYEEANALLDQGHTPDAILADVILPEGDGRDIARTLAGRLPGHTRLVFMSAYDAEELSDFGTTVNEHYISKTQGEAMLAQAVALALTPAEEG